MWGWPWSCRFCFFGGESLVGRHGIWKSDMRHCSAVVCIIVALLNRKSCRVRAESSCGCSRFLNLQTMPTIVLLGAQSAGKSTVADYLVAEEGFRRVRIRSSRQHISAQDQQDCLYFDNAADFLDYATLHWRDRFVTSGVRSRKELDPFVKRPWVLLVGCEAGVGWRWRRRNEV